MFLEPEDLALMIIYGLLIVLGFFAAVVGLLWWGQP